MHLSQAFILSEDDYEEWDPDLPIEPASGHSSTNTPAFLSGPSIGSFRQASR